MPDLEPHYNFFCFFLNIIFNFDCFNSFKKWLILSSPLNGKSLTKNDFSSAEVVQKATFYSHTSSYGFPEKRDRVTNEAFDSDGKFGRHKNTN